MRCRPTEPAQSKGGACAIFPLPKFRYDREMKVQIHMAMIAALLLGGAPAGAAGLCPGRVLISYGDTLSSIANACGISVAALRSANPGLSAANLRAGMSITVPRPALPSPMAETNRPLVRIAPPLVPPAIGGGGSSTVILPPEPLPVPQQHILRGFGDKPGQLPLPPGHSSPFN